MRRRFIKTTSSKLSQFDINNYITIQALEDNLTITVGITNRAYYGIDGIGWNEYDTMSEILLNKGQTVSFKGTNVKPRFYIDKPCNILGNGYSLLVGDDAVNITDISVFGNKILSFEGCPIINVASSFLPATTLASDCYEFMFYGCTNLTTAPALPATTLASYCCYGMFYGCSSLTTAPELPATTLAVCCYESMFYGCTNLTTAPALPATTLARSCYHAMFDGCTKLNYIKMLATSISAVDCLKDWVRGVAIIGTFVKNAAMTSLPTATVRNSYAGIPSGWKVQNA